MFRATCRYLPLPTVAYRYLPLQVKELRVPGEEVTDEKAASMRVQLSGIASVVSRLMQARSGRVTAV